MSSCGRDLWLCARVVVDVRNPSDLELVIVDVEKGVARGGLPLTTHSEIERVSVQTQPNINAHTMKVPDVAMWVTTL